MLWQWKGAVPNFWPETRVGASCVAQSAHIYNIAGARRCRWGELLFALHSDFGCGPLNGALAIPDIFISEWDSGQPVQNVETLHEFACHPFAGAMLIFSVSIPIYHMCCLSKHMQPFLSAYILISFLLHDPCTAVQARGT